MYKKHILILILLVAVTLMGCETADILTTGEIPDKDWDLIESSAEGTTINIYLTKDDDRMRGWFSNDFSRILENDYGLVGVVKTLTFEDVLNTFDAEKTLSNSEGSMDLLILKDDEFTQLKAMGYLYEDVSTKLPNYNDRINMFDSDIMTEHGTSLEDYGVPIGREQFVMLFDEDILESAPATPEDMLTFLKANKYVFTYANPTTDPVGAEFVKSIVCGLLDENTRDQLLMPGLTMDEVTKLVQPGMDYLKQLDQVIMKDGGQYFEKQGDIDQAFLEGLLYFSMTSEFGAVEDMVKEEFYPEGAKSFIFENGSISDTVYVVIPHNAANKSGALVAINNLLSVETQIDKYEPGSWGSLPVLDLKLLSDAEQELFEKASVKRSTLRVEALQPNRFPELPLSTQKMILEIWAKQIP